MDALRAVAEREPLEDIPLDDLDRTLAIARRSAGKGADQLGPADARGLPPSARSELAEILQECERELAWPWQLLVALICLQAKPTGGDRPIGLLCMSITMWELLRRAPMQQWCRDRAGFWDDAVEKSPALRCALLRWGLCRGRCGERLRLWGRNGRYGEIL